MVKTYKTVLSLVCCLLLATVFSFPLAAQSTAPQSTTPSGDVNQDRNLSTPSTPSDQYNSTQPSTQPSDQYNSGHPAVAPETQPSDLDRQKSSDPAAQDKSMDTTTTTERSQTTTSTDRNKTDSDKDLPRTATGMPLVGLIGAASLTAAAIRRRYF